MKFYIKALLIVLVSIFSKESLSDHTVLSGQKITKISHDGSDGSSYFETSGGWKAKDCEPRFIWVKASLSGSKEILSLAMAAKMANRAVVFHGKCTENKKYFESYYITVN